MLIGELSQQVNLSRDTIRFYEKMELIQPLVRNNGYKDYPEQTLQQLKLIQTAKNLGFTLAEIKQIINALEIFDYSFDECVSGLNFFSCSSHGL